MTQNVEPIDPRLMAVRLYWSDGRIEDLRVRLDVTVHPGIIRKVGEGHVHFAFTGQVDAEGFAVFEEVECATP